MLLRIILGGLLVAGLGYRIVVLARGEQQPHPRRSPLVGGGLMLASGVLAVIAHTDGFDLFVAAMLVVFGLSTLVEPFLPGRTRTA